MNSLAKLSSLLLITTFVFIGFACETGQNGNSNHNGSSEDPENAIPLIYHMSFMQQYVTKLYFSGMEENWGLADIYAHEIEEITETLISEEHVDDGINVSELLANMLSPQLEQIESAIDAENKDLFEGNFQTMVQTCNQCHQAADYELVKVKIPETNPFAQDFSVPE